MVDAVKNTSSGLFSNVPDDYFNLFNQGVVDGKKVAQLLGYKREDIATAANIPFSSVRYDTKKMPLELKERFKEWAIALNLVYSFFNDHEKTILWFSIPNPHLGGISPKNMIRIGRFRKLLHFIQTALDENQR